ncbi:endo-1,4-beta-xylanase [Daejeonia sp. YH14]|uniref:endo-1,4-beta-xylanase n=1 Tax=Daejeonia sp. YH14 TaxID=3439042 RepID=UPI003F490B16
MKKNIIHILLAAGLAAVSACTALHPDSKTLKTALKNDFYMGTAMNLPQIYGKDKKSVDIIKKQFNSIVAENCMKSMYLQPREGAFHFEDADRFVDFGEQNNMFIIGHTLIWHSQAPRWFFTDNVGKDVSPEVLKQRMKNHITTVMSRYKGRIKGWDVVNEAILEDGTYRKSKFYEILGEEFIPLAFQYAHEADPSAELYYNDYNEWYPAKKETVIQLIKKLKSKGLRIDAVGMQAHLGMDGPLIKEYETAIVDYAAAGVKVNITELDISPLPNPGKMTANISDTIAYREEINPYTHGLPKNIETEWENRYLDFFRLFLKHHDKIERVTVWGVADTDSWKNNFPVHGRTDYPLLFDRNYQEKPLVKKIIRLAEEQK